jgi:hypothetical protein
MARGMVWIALVFMVLTVAGSAGIAALRGWRAWRAFKTTTSRVTDGIGAVLSTAGEAETRVVAIAEGAARFSAATGRLRRSRAELAVLQQAAGEPRALVRSLRSFGRA